MSIFICNACGKQIDSDFYGCHEDPNDKCKLICENCFNGGSMKIIIYLEPIGYQIDIEDIGISECRDYGDNINITDGAKLIKFLVENLDNKPKPRVILP